MYVNSLPSPSAPSSLLPLPFPRSCRVRVALSEACKRGWLSYSDLYAVWHSTNTQTDMTTACKTTAKVCTCVCVWRGGFIIIMTLASKRWRYVGIEHYSNRVLPAWGYKVQHYINQPLLSIVVPYFLQKATIRYCQRLVEEINITCVRVNSCMW